MSSAKDATEFLSNSQIKKSSMNLDNGHSDETLIRHSVSSLLDEYASCSDSIFLLEIPNKSLKLSNKLHIEVFQTNRDPVEGNEQTSVIEAARDLIPSFDARSYAVPVPSKECEISAELLPIGEGVRFEACQAGEYIRNQHEESKIADPGRSNVEAIQVINELITIVEADGKYSVINESPRSKVIQIDDAIDLKNLAKVSNLVPQFEKCKIVDEISTISPKFLVLKKQFAEKASQSNCSPLPDVCKRLNEIGIEKNLQHDIEKLRISEINQSYGRFVDSKETITGVTIRNTKSIFDDDCEINLDYKEFEKGVKRSEGKCVLDKIKSLEGENFAEGLAEEKLDQSEKPSEIIRVTLRKPGPSQEKFDLHEVSSKIGHTNIEAAKKFVTESNEPGIGNMSETEDIPKDIRKILDDINFSKSPDKISYINESAKEIKVNLEISTTETIKSELSSKTKNIMKEISEFAKHSTPAKSPICVEPTTGIKAHTSQLKATTSQAVEVKNSKLCINSGKKQTVVKGQMAKSAKISEKNVISCRQKTTLDQNKTAKFPPIASSKDGSKTTEPKLASGKIEKSVKTQEKVPTSFGQSGFRKFESKPAHRYEVSGRLPLAKCPSRELKPAVKTFPAKSGLSNGDSSSKTEERQKPLKSFKPQTFSKQAVVAKVCSSNTATASKTTTEDNAASSSSTKISNSALIRIRQRTFPGKITTKNPKEAKLEKPRWR